MRIENTKRNKDIKFRQAKIRFARIGNSVGDETNSMTNWIPGSDQFRWLEQR